MVLLWASGSYIARCPIGASHDEIVALVEWQELSQFLSGILAFAEGEPGGPKLTLLRALLVATWHDLSEVRLVEALDD